MKHARMAVATALALTGASSAMAGNQSVAFVGDDAEFVSLGHGLAVTGGTDVITFSGLAAGAYDFKFTFSSQNLDVTSVKVDGSQAALFGTPGTVFASLTGTANTPFDIVVKGTRLAPGALYSGQLSVTPVPEPVSLALLLAGLGGLGFVARRRMRPRA